MIEKFNKNAKGKKFTNLLGLAIRLIVIDPFLVSVTLSLVATRFVLQATLAFFGRPPFWYFVVSQLTFFRNVREERDNTRQIFEITKPKSIHDPGMLKKVITCILHYCKFLCKTSAVYLICKNSNTP